MVKAISVHGHVLDLVLLVSGLVFSLFIAAFPVKAEPTDTVLSLEDIVAGVDALQSQIEDLSVEFSFNAIKEDPKNLGYRSHMRVTVKGERIDYDHVYGASPAVSAKVFAKEIAFNGKQTTSYLKNFGTAAVSVERSREASTKGMGFFDLMLLNRPQTVLPSIGDQNLSSLLKLPDARLRQKMEVVDGHLCHVVDVKQPGSVSVTVWIDCVRGFLPMRHVWFAPSAKPDMEFSIEEAAEVAHGFWFATRGRKLLHADGRMIKGECEWRLVVDTDAAGKPKISVNAGIENNFFDIWRRLPSGTLLVDKQANRATAVGDKDYQAMVQNLEIDLASADLSIPERGTGDQPTPAPIASGALAPPMPASGASSNPPIPAAHGTLFWLSLELGALVGIGFLIWRIRRRTSAA
jgi:hypothetical protein